MLAVSGQTWQALRSSCSAMTIAQIVARGAVFARMSPEHKQQLVQELQSIGYCVGKKKLKLSIYLLLDFIRCKNSVFFKNSIIINEFKLLCLNFVLDILISTS